VADFCDAFGGGWTREDILRILKDSRVGSFGALGLGLAVLLRVGATAALPPADLLAATVAASAWGRWVILPIMALVPPVSDRPGSARDFGREVRGPGGRPRASSGPWPRCSPSSPRALACGGRLRGVGRLPGLVRLLPPSPARRGSPATAWAPPATPGNCSSCSPQVRGRWVEAVSVRASLHGRVPDASDRRCARPGRADLSTGRSSPCVNARHQTVRRAVTAEDDDGPASLFSLIIQVQFLRPDELDLVRRQM
jgi:hypothetical protein